MPKRAPKQAIRRAFPLLALLLAGPLLVAQSAGAPPAAGAGKTAPAVDEAAEKAAQTVVETIDNAVEAREPAKIKPVFVTLDEKWTKFSPKSLKRVTKSLSNMFAKLKPLELRDIDTLGDDARNGRFNPDGDEGSANAQAGEALKQDILDVFHTAVGLLYDKPEGPAVLLPVLKLQHIKNWPEVQVLVLEGLGYREEPALEKEFEAYLRHENSMVASAAATALGHLREQPIDVRRHAASSLVDAFSAAQKASEKEAEKAGEDDERPLRRYLSNITVDFRDALTALTHQTFDKPDEWRAWFDAHGKDKDW